MREATQKLPAMASVAFIIWVVFFSYAICAALLFQQAQLSLLPGVHAGGGLLRNLYLF